MGGIIYFVTINIALSSGKLICELRIIFLSLITISPNFPVRGAPSICSVLSKGAAGKYLHVIPQPANFYDAMELCDSRGGRIARAASEADRKDIISAIKGTYSKRLINFWTLARGLKKDLLD